MHMGNTSIADFSGTWKLNVAKSFLSREHPASDYQLTRVIEQTKGAIKVTETSLHGSSRSSLLPDTRIATLYTDGQEHETPGPAQFRGRATTTMVMAEWQGNTLAITERGNGSLASSTTRRRYYVAADGTQLIELVEGYSLRGDTEQRLVFDKQS